MEDLELLCKVAKMYYEDNLTQNDISQQIHTSRPTISRLLQEARDKGIVEIIIHYPWTRSTELEQEVMSRFQLSDAVILDSQKLKPEDITKGVYQLAAGYIQGQLRKNTSLGISWGRTIYNTIKAFRPGAKLPIKVIQLFGAANVSNRLTDGPDLTRQLANIYSGECHFIHAPLFVANPKAREALLQDKYIKQTLALAYKADMVLTGIGALTPEHLDNHSSISYLDLSTLQELIDQGAVGHICAQYYNINGDILDTDIHKYLIGIPLESLKKIKQVIGIAMGESKITSILGALRGKHINTLISDTATIKKVLAIDTLSD